MKFVQETGAIIANDGGLISMFDGEPGHVDFPDQMIAQLHKLQPGYIQRFTHTHPPGMPKPSGQDNSMMSNLAMVVYPFPVRLGIIVPQSWVLAKREGEFVENVYQWVFEPREVWQARKMIHNDTKRAIVYEKVDSTIFTYSDGILSKKHQPHISSWQDWIIERSYSWQ